MTHDILASEEWLAAVARMTDAIGTEDFSVAVLEAIDVLLPNDSNVILGFRRNAKPIVLYDRLHIKVRPLFYKYYMGGAYLLATFYNAFLDDHPSGFYTALKLVPPDFEEQEYYRRYFQYLEVDDAGGYLVRLTNDSAVMIDFLRRESNAPFSEAEIKCCRLVNPVIQSLAKRHWQAWAQREADETGRTSHEALYKRFESFGSRHLTERECEVVRLILKGHSAKSLARELDISPGTASVHRQNIYRKLNVNSQGDLFARFIDYMVSPCEPVAC